jgi:hypothetical protein
MKLATVCAVLMMTAAFSVPALAADTVPFHAAIQTQPQPVVFPCGPVCQLDIPGFGNASHMGAIQAPGESTLNLITLEQTGSFLLIAANGDSMAVTFSGTFLPSGPTFDDPVTFMGTWTIMSGTGRFAGATGSGTYQGTAVGAEGTVWLDGTISTVGSNKK